MPKSGISKRPLRDFTDNVYSKYGSIWDFRGIIKITSDERYLIGTDGDDGFDIGYLAGSPFDATQVLYFLGGGGDDAVGGSSRNDSIWGGLGNDLLLLGYDGNDNIYGEQGDDKLYGQAGADYLNGGIGLDKLQGGDGADQLAGGANDDVLSGQVGNDILWGGDGDDFLWGDDGNDSLFGNAGADQLVGDVGLDTLDGGLGNDTLFGLDGADKLFGDAGADELQGGNENDQLSGEANNDKLFGQTGNDLLWGGDGNDILVGFTASNELKQTLNAGETDTDTLYGGNGTDNLYGGLGSDILDGGTDNDLLSGGNGDDRLFGGSEKDELQGNDGDDQLMGESGDDRMFGQVGNDILWGGSGNDILVGFTASNESQNLNAGETDNDWLYGGIGNDLLISGLGADTLHGESGNDELQAGAGNDLLYGEDGADNLFGQVGNDILYGGNGDDILIGFTASNEAKQNLNVGESDNDWLYGGAGHDYMLGGLGNDYLDGGAGADEMEGGAGDDVYIVNSVNDSILEKVGAGYDTVISSTNYLLNQGVEELRLLEGFTIHGTGNALNNKIIGNSSDNILDGVTGQDTMIGADGNDTYYIDNAGDQVVELLGGGVDRVQSTISYTLGDYVENLMLLDFSKPEQGLVDGVDVLVYGYPKMNELDYLQGDANTDYQGTCALTSIANLLTQIGTPTSEANVLDVAIDNDWTVSDPNKPAYERGGSNPVQQQAILTEYGIRNDLLPGYNAQGIANLIMSGRGVIIGVNAGKLWGEDAYILNGNVNHAVTVTGVVYNESDDSLMGFYIADSGRHKVSDMTRFVSLAQFRAAANVGSAYAIYTIEPLKLWDEDINGQGNSLNNVIIGNRGDNRLNGSGGDDKLSGGAGDDTLSGGSGADTMTGGAGNDSYVVDSSQDVVTEAFNEGTDTVQSGVTYTLDADVENLTLTGSSAIDGTGNGLSNVLTGNSAANTLIGGGGADTYVVGSGDSVVEAVNAGTDMVLSSSTFALSDNVENLTLTGSSAINGTGNSLNNQLTGNNAANILNGDTGADTMLGNSGNDTYIVDNVADVVTEMLGKGTDEVRSNVAYTLAANIENLTLTGTAAINGTGNGLDNVLTGNNAANTLVGNTGNDQLIGATGFDTLYGGTGNDLLSGGLGADKFVFDTALNASTNNDTIADFSVVDDIIRLENYIFAKFTVTGALAAGSFVSGAGAIALDSNDYLIYNTTDGSLYYDADGSGAGAKVEFVSLTGTPALTASDFAII